MAEKKAIPSLTKRRLVFAGKSDIFLPELWFLYSSYRGLRSSLKNLVRVTFLLFSNWGKKLLTGMGLCWDWRECFHCLETWIFTCHWLWGSRLTPQGAPKLSYWGSWSIPWRHIYSLKLPMSCSSFLFSLLLWNYRFSTMLWWSVANNVILHTYNILVCASN